MFYLIIKYFHSGIRWLLVLALILLIIQALRGISGKQKYASKHKVVLGVTFGLMHTQILLGIILYFISPKVVFSIESFSYQIQRFFLVEHAVGMLISIAIFTIGYYRIKKKQDDRSKFILQFVYVIITFLIMIITIPWPFLNYGSQWI